MGNCFGKLTQGPTQPVDQTGQAPDQQLDLASQPVTVSEGVEDKASQDDAVSDGIEEGKDAYQPGGFHPVYIGDVFNDRYKVLNKIGYGQYSTVWLVRDSQASGDGPDVFRALKVLSAVCYGQGNDTFEKEILTHLRDGDREHMGHAYICHLLDDFEHQGPNGIHTCLVFELMGETLGSFGVWFEEDMIPNSVMHRFAIQLVVALDFAHDHGVVHTDIKPDNVFVKFRDYSLIESGYLQEVPIPQQDRKEAQYSPVPSQPLRYHYFNEADSTHVDEFDIALGDWGVSSWTSKHLCEKIQPVALRSPEVLIGAPWGESTDWWNLGAVLLEVFRAVRMFDGRTAPYGEYELKEHLFEIVDLFGPFPKALIEKADQGIIRDLFDEDGRIKNATPQTRPGLASEAFMPGLSEERREQFGSFLKLMMKIDPEERPSAMDLLRHPWLDAVQD